jgi:TPP-dependent pyruvate/acetoin dehydrogenase alpha subunit
LKGIEVEVKQKVDEDVKKARSDSEIEVDELFYDMYENNLQGNIRGITPWDRHAHKKTIQAQNI